MSETRKQREVKTHLRPVVNHLSVTLHSTLKMSLSVSTGNRIADCNSFAPVNLNRLVFRSVPHKCSSGRWFCLYITLRELLFGIHPSLYKLSLVILTVNVCCPEFSAETTEAIRHSCAFLWNYFIAGHRQYGIAQAKDQVIIAPTEMPWLGFFAYCKIEIIIENEGPWPWTFIDW